MYEKIKKILIFKSKKYITYLLIIKLLKNFKKVLNCKLKSQKVIISYREISSYKIYLMFKVQIYNKRKVKVIYVK